MLNNELNDYSKQDPSDETDELITSESNLEGYSDFTKIVKIQKFGGFIE